VSRFARFTLLFAAASCASAPAAPVARRSGGGWIASPPETGENSASASRPLDRFARRLSDLAVDELSLADAGGDRACHGVTPPFRVVSALSDSGEGVSCLVGDGGVACANFVDHEPGPVVQALCGDSAEQVDVPSRVRQLASAAEPGWRIAPIPAPEGYRALSLRAGHDYYLMVRRGPDWIASPLPVARTDGQEAGPERLLESRALTEEPSFLLISASARGSVQQGELTTRLLVLSDQLAERTVRDIGILVWTVDPDERTPDSPPAPRSGPHLEVRLEPSITGDGVLRLDLLREHRPEPDRQRFEREPCTPSGEGDLLALACPVHRLDLIAKDAGFWRFEDGALVKSRR
jgi:hypothetical protein